jgi:hypothetical protein
LVGARRGGGGWRSGRPIKLSESRQTHDGEGMLDLPMMIKGVMD